MKCQWRWYVSEDEVSVKFKCQWSDDEDEVSEDEAGEEEVRFKCKQ